MEYLGYQNSLWILHMGKLITEGIMKSTLVVVYQQTLHMKLITVCLCVCLHFCLRHWKSEVNPEGDSLLSRLTSHFSFFSVSFVSVSWVFFIPLRIHHLKSISQSVCSADQREYRDNIQMHWIQTHRTSNTSQTGKAVTRTKCQGHEQSQRTGEREKVTAFKGKKALCLCMW